MSAPLEGGRPATIVRVISEVDGKKYRVRLPGTPDNVTVGRIRKSLAKPTGIPIPEQKLSLAGQPLLDDAVTVAQLGINESSNVLLSRVPEAAAAEAWQAQPGIDEVEKAPSTTSSGKGGVPRRASLTAATTGVATAAPPPAAVQVATPPAAQPAYMPGFPRYLPPELMGSVGAAPWPLPGGALGSCYLPSATSSAGPYGRTVETTVTTTRASPTELIEHTITQRGPASGSPAEVGLANPGSTPPQEITPAPENDAKECFWVYFVLENKKHKIPVVGDYSQITVNQIKGYMQGSYPHLDEVRQCLSFNGMVLEDDQTAGDIGLENGSVILLNVVGGTTAPSTSSADKGKQPVEEKPEETREVQADGSEVEAEGEAGETTQQAPQQQQGETGSTASSTAAAGDGGTTPQQPQPPQIVGHHPYIHNPLDPTLAMLPPGIPAYQATMVNPRGGSPLRQSPGYEFIKIMEDRRIQDEIDRLEARKTALQAQLQRSRTPPPPTTVGSSSTTTTTTGGTAQQPAAPSQHQPSENRLAYENQYNINNHALSEFMRTFTSWVYRTQANTRGPTQSPLRHISPPSTFPQRRASAPTGGFGHNSMTGSGLGHPLALMVEEEQRIIEAEKNRMEADRSRMNEFFQHREHDFTIREKRLEQERQLLLKRQQELLTQAGHQPASPASPITVDVTNDDSFEGQQQQQQGNNNHPLAAPQQQQQPTGTSNTTSHWPHKPTLPWELHAAAAAQHAAVAQPFPLFTPPW